MTSHARWGWALVLTLSVLLSALASGCRADSVPGSAPTASGSSGDDGKPVVVVSVPPQAFFVEKIAGDLVQVEVMIPPASNPATYEPTIKQMQAISRASVYVKVGHPNFPFEATWMAKLLENNSDIRVVDGSSGLDVLEGDPHTWVSPDGARVMCKQIEAALSSLLPDAREELDGNLQDFMQEIDALDLEISELFIEHVGESFLVFHPAWGYFARDYGLQQISIEHDHKEPGLHHVSELIAEAKAAGSRVVFVQPQFSQQSAELIAEEIGGEVVQVDPLARNWLENLSSVADAFAEAVR